VTSPVLDESGKIINYISIRRDVTVEAMLEKELRQAQKMESIGTLAGGIAHDFNNILAAIMGYTEMARTRIAEDDPLRRNLDQVFKAGLRAKDLVRQILTFSRQAEQERKPLQICTIVNEALKLLRSSLPSTIEIKFKNDLGPAGGIVMADPTQIHQVLLNLCTNAAHAMRAKGGTLSVELSEIEDASLLTGQPDLMLGTYVCLRVSDTGHGMETSTMERIFDPYFTTKGLGEGTGLGLSVVQGIVKSHGGTINVKSTQGKGTCFCVLLPAIEQETAPEVEQAPPLLLGKERILFVDDEQALADLGKEILETLGYNVTIKTRSREALEAFRADPNAFDLVITDMTMPELTGRDLARELMAIRSSIPVILCTGFSDQINAEQAENNGICGFLMKPYAISAIARTIREALERK
jgi:nitrogen-specific signal transduction histidine kinase